MSVLYDKNTVNIVKFLLDRDGSYLAEMNRELKISKPTIASRIKGLKTESFLDENWVEIEAAEANTWVKMISIKPESRKRLKSLI